MDGESDAVDGLGQRRRRAGCGSADAGAGSAAYQCRGASALLSACSARERRTCAACAPCLGRSVRSHGAACCAADQAPRPPRVDDVSCRGMLAAQSARRVSARADPDLDRRRVVLDAAGSRACRRTTHYRRARRACRVRSTRRRRALVGPDLVG